MITPGLNVRGQEQPTTSQRRVIVIRKDDGQPEKQGQVVRIATGRFLLGIQLASLSVDERKQAGIKNRQALKIVSVNPGSVAEKAGLESGDIILAIDDQRLSGHEMLVKAVQASGKARKPLALRILHDGKALTRKINPARSSPSIGISAIRIEGGSLRGIENQLRGLRIFDEKDGAGIRLRIAGAEVPPAADDGDDKRSENLEIQIRKENDKPARIEVKRNGKRWSITEKEIDKLPKDIRQRVRDAIKHGQRDKARVIELRIGNDRTLRLALPEKDGDGKTKKARVILRQSAGSRDGLLEKLERLQKQVEKLQREVRELKKKFPTDN